MTRCVFALLAALSLLLCVATAVLWVRSYWVRDQWRHGNGYRTRSLTSQRGQLCISGYRFTSDMGRERFTWQAEPGGVFRGERSWSGFGHSTHVDRQMSNGAVEVYMFYSAFWVPHWAAVLLSALAPAGQVRTYLRRRHLDRRRQRGQCASCGYDLRSTPGRCPECGTATASLGQNPTRYDALGAAHAPPTQP
jgi:hypothetical protein